MRTKLIKLTIIMCCGIFSINANAQTINLQLQNSYTLTGGTNGLPKFDVGDLNNDGRPDIVTASNMANVPVNVSLNNGTGGFSAPISFGATLTATAVAIGDFNNDGKADLAVGTSNNTTGAVNIRLGDGTGNFPNGTDTVVTQTATDLATADFNGDGNLDLAMTNSNGYATQPTNAVRVMLGNGAGGFGAPTNYGPIGSLPQDIVIADFNADGRPDVAAVAFTTTNTVSLLLNNGAGGFTAAPAISWSNISAAGKITAGDFNRDCATDLAVSRAGSVVILLGNNTGNFTLTPITTTNNPASLAVGDFNLDRKPDLAMGSGNTTGFSILPGDGAGGFGTAFSLTLSAIPDNLAVLDANLDGKTDVALSTRGNSFSLYNGSSNVFLRTENDFDADGKTDLSVFRPSLGDWFIQRSTQGFSQTHWGLSGDKLAPADYDGDFKTDLAVWRENGYGDPNRSYFFILQSSNNTFRQEQFGRVGDVPTAVGDWDGDGRADPAVYRSGVGAGSQSFFFYRPSGTAGVDFRTIWWGTSGDQPVRGDFDGDGKLDAAVFRPSNSIWYVSQSSNGQTLYQSWGTSADRPVPADYDGDGKTDVAVFRPSNNIWYFLKSATGTPSYSQWGISGDSLAPADYNGDGKAEVAVYRPSEQRWYIPPCAVTNAVNTKFGSSGDVAVPVAP
jgi:FG-GAP-like repeat/FG-GAP repeat